MNTDSNQNQDARDKWKRLSVPTQLGVLDFIFHKNNKSWHLVHNFEEIGSFDLDGNHWQHNAIDITREMPWKHYCVFDADENTIWMHFVEGVHCRLCKIQLTVYRTDQIWFNVDSIEEIDFPHVGMKFVQMLVVGDVLHIIADVIATFSTHITINKHSLEIQQNDIGSPLLGTNLIHVNDTLYLFGGAHDLQNDRRRFCSNVNSLLSYSLETRQWTQIQVTKQESLISGMAFYATCAAALNISPLQQYIVLFRGTNPLGMECNKDLIAVYDIQQNAFKRCSLELPLFVKNAVEHVSYDCIVIRHQKREELSVMGFIRRCYKSAEFEEVSLVPDAIKQLLCKWVLIEYVHLIGVGGVTRSSHFCIAVDDIVSSIVLE